MTSRLSCCLLLLLCTAPFAAAQNYPVKPIRIVTTEAGSGTDFGARMVAQCISGPLGQQVVVENRGGVMANEVVAKAQPDGYTLVHNGSALWLLPFVQPDLGWNPQRDFIAVSMNDQWPKPNPANSTTRAPRRPGRRIFRPSSSTPWPASRSCRFRTRAAGRR